MSFVGLAEMADKNRVKGKQVRDLCELVTVNAECFCQSLSPGRQPRKGSHWDVCPGKADSSMMMHEPGNLPYSWYRIYVWPIALFHLHIEK